MLFAKLIFEVTVVSTGLRSVKYVVVTFLLLANGIVIVGLTRRACVGTDPPAVVTCVNVTKVVCGFDVRMIFSSVFPSISWPSDRSSD